MTTHRFQVARSANVFVADGGAAVLESSATVTAEPGATLSAADSTQSVVVLGQNEEDGRTIYRAEYEPLPEPGAGASQALRRKRRALQEAHDQALLAAHAAATPTAGSGGVPMAPVVPAPAPLDAKKRGGKCFKAGQEACPVGNGRFECIDTTRHLESCGGCWLEGLGKDCTMIQHVEGVECVRGGCLVREFPRSLAD